MVVSTPTLPQYCVISHGSSDLWFVRASVRVFLVSVRVFLVSVRVFLVSVRVFHGLKQPQHFLPLKADWAILLQPMCRAVCQPTKVCYTIARKGD